METGSARRLLAVLVACGAACLTIAACRGPLEPLERAITTLEAAPTRVAAGDTVSLLGIVRNPTRTTIRPLSGCAPGIGFLVTDPNGGSYSLYDGLAFVCPLLDSQEIEPGEVDSVSWRWPTPLATGVYEVRAGLYTSEGLRSLSTPKRITVR